MGVFDVTANDVPAIRIAKAIGDGVSKNILFIVDGGIGDRICAEPTLRYSFHSFDELEFSLLCETPELFGHLPFKNIYRSLDKVPKDQYLALHTYGNGNLSNQFFNANLMHSVDFASVSSIRMQIPVEFKKPNLIGNPPIDSLKELLRISGEDKWVLLHPGKTWDSRTIPKEWWEDLILDIVEAQLLPIIIGNNTIDINTKYCIDMRSKFSLSECVYVSQSAPLVTNDSGPLHMAASGRHKIAYLSTVRHPDLLKHWRFDETGRNYEYGCNMKNFTKNKPWELFMDFPNNLEEKRIDKFPTGRSIDEFLPDQGGIVEWLL